MGQRWLLVLALAGCFSSKSGGGTTAPPTNTVAPAKPPRDHRAAVADPLGFLPIDSEVVFHLDADRLRRSAIWRQYEPMVVNAASSTLKRLQETCGIDPIAQLRTIRVGVKDLGGANKPQGVIVVTGLDGDRLLKCFHSATPKPANMTIEGNIVLGTDSSGQPFAMELVDRATLVAVLGPGTDRARLDEVVNGGAPLRNSAVFSEIFGTINTQSALWFLLNGSSSAFDGLRTSGLGFNSVFGSVGLVDGLSASVRIRVDSPGAASQMSSMVTSQVGMARSFVDRLDVSADANDVVLELGMTDAQLTSLFGLMGGAFGLAPLPPPPTTP